MNLDITPDQRHEALMNQLKGHLALKHLANAPQERIGSSKWEKMDYNKINNGVGLLIAYWNLSGGSVGGFNLYELLQGYMTNPEARKEINAIIKKY